MIPPHVGRLYQVLVQSHFFALICSFPHVLCNYPYTHLCFVQKEIISLANTAAQLYRKFIPEALRNTPTTWDTMTEAHDRLIRIIRSRNFRKFIYVAHKDNGEGFFQEVLPSPLLFLCASSFVLLYSCFMYMFLHYTILCCRLTIILLPSLSRI